MITELSITKSLKTLILVTVAALTLPLTPAAAQSAAGDLMEAYVYHGTFRYLPQPRLLLYRSTRFAPPLPSIYQPNATRQPVRLMASMTAVGTQRVARFNSFTITNDVWNGGNSLWSIGSNWSTGVPGSSSNVLIDNGNSTASNVTLDVNSTINNLTVD